MTHPIPTQEFKDKLKDLISNNSRITNPIKEKLIEKLKPEHIEKSHPSTPGEPNYSNISATTEVAFQRAIYKSSTLLNNCSSSKSENIDWIDIEIPVVLNSNGRRPCIDIIGSTTNDLILCELKYKGNSDPTDSPIYAVYELLIYYYLVRCNYENLDKGKVYHKSAVAKNFKWEDFLKNKTPKLLVTANDSYWKYWFKKFEEENYKAELLKEISDIEKILQIEIQLFQTKDDNYKEQKEKGGDKNDKYNPQVISPKWEKICN